MILLWDALAIGILANPPPTGETCEIKLTVISSQISLNPGLHRRALLQCPVWVRNRHFRSNSEELDCASWSSKKNSKVSLSSEISSQKVKKMQKFNKNPLFWDFDRFLTIFGQRVIQEPLPRCHHSWVDSIYTGAKNSTSLVTSLWRRLMFPS